MQYKSNRIETLEIKTNLHKFIENIDDDLFLMDIYSIFSKKLDTKSHIKTFPKNLKKT